MSIAEQIVAEMEHLSAARQAEVLDFVGYLRSREALAYDSGADAAWKRFSLTVAMRDLEDEPDLYQVSDIREPVE